MMHSRHLVIKSVKDQIITPPPKVGTTFGGNKLFKDV